MSSKQRKEKFYSIHGMQSILSAFITRHQFAIKPYDSYATNRASTGCLSRCLEQFGYVKKNTQWKIRRYKSTSLFQITIGYNQWCPRLHHKKRTSNSLKCIQFPQYTQYKRFPQKEEKDEMEEKVVDLQKKKRGREDKGERHNEKKARKMGTEERERRRSR